jgi:hypothetical protein
VKYRTIVHRDKVEQVNNTESVFGRLCWSALVGLSPYIGGRWRHEQSQSPAPPSPPMQCSTLINDPTVLRRSRPVQGQQNGDTSGPRKTTHVKIKLMTSRWWGINDKGRVRKRKRPSRAWNDASRQENNDNFCWTKRALLGHILTTYCAPYYRPLFPATRSSRKPFTGGHTITTLVPFLLSNALPQQLRSPAVVG